jgi:hypothetical protein
MKTFFGYSFLFIICLLITFTQVSCDKEAPLSKTATLYTQTKEKGTSNGTDYTYTQVVVEERGEGTGTTTWTSDKVYILDGFVFVNEGQTLTIEAGTVIKGKEGNGENASALIVARGGKIIAEGTAAKPIVFTSIADRLLNNALDASGNRVAVEGGNLGTTQGLWGGVVLLGKATINTPNGSAKQIEGVPTSEARGLYGGTNDADNSGTVKYVSIRHGGSDIGAGNEINGLTLGAVGNGTQIDYVEIFANKDDGVEWFGGTVNTKHLVISNCGDDAVDYDEGWRGQNQFWFIDQTAGGDNGGEHDGGPSDCEACQPYATPIVYNATFIASSASRALRFRDNAGGEYHNSIFNGYGKGWEVELLTDAQDSYKMFENGLLKFQNNIVYGPSASSLAFVSAGDGVSDADKSAANAALLAYFNTTCHNVDPMLNIYYVPTNAGYTSATSASGAFFTAAAYKGAFNTSTASSNWMQGWTIYEQL